jgi:hypothetical protein
MKKNLSKVDPGTEINKVIKIGSKIDEQKIKEKDIFEGT